MVIIKIALDLLKSYDINPFPPQLPLNQITFILQLVNFCYSKCMLLYFLLLKFSQIYLHYISTTHREHLESQFESPFILCIVQFSTSSHICLYSRGPHCLTFFEQIHILLFLSLYSCLPYRYLIVKGLLF